MNVIKTDIEGLYVIEPRVFADDRGYFFESYNQREFDEKAFGEELSKFEHAWTMKHTKYPVEPKKTKEIVPLGKYDYPLPRFERAMDIYERWMKQ